MAVFFAVAVLPFPEAQGFEGAAACDQWSTSCLTRSAMLLVAVLGGVAALGLRQPAPDRVTTLDRLLPVNRSAER